MKRRSGSGALLAAALCGGALGPVAFAGLGSARHRRRRRRAATQGHVAPGRSQSSGRHGAPRRGTVEPGAQPRRRPGRTEPDRPGPSGRGGVDPRLARLPPLPDAGAVRRGVRARARPRWRRCRRRCAARASRSGRRSPGSVLLPVSGTTAVVSAAFGTPLEPVQPPGGSRAVVNTTSPQVPVVVGRAGDRRRRPGRSLHGALDAAQAHPDVERRPQHRSWRRSSHAHHAEQPLERTNCTERDEQQPRRLARRHAPGVRRCGVGGGRRGLHVDDSSPTIFGLNQLFAQGRTGIGQTIAIVEFEQYLPERLHRVPGVLRADQFHPQRDRRRRAGRSGRRADGEAALDTELAAVQRALRLARRLRGTQRQTTRGVRPVQPDRQRRQPPRWSRRAGGTARP